MIMFLKATYQRVTHSVPHVGSVLGAGDAILGAIDLNTVQVWTGALVAVGAAIWGFWRDQRRRDFEAEERKKWIQTMVDANVAAVEKGLPPPFPQLNEIIMKPQ